MKKKEPTYKGYTVKEWVELTGYPEWVVRQEIKESGTKPDKK